MKDIAELTKKLGDKDSSIRRSAAEALGLMADERVVDSLIPVLKDKNRFVRQEAILALGKIGGSRSVEYLTQALNTEKDEFVKDFIRKALERMQSKGSASLTTPPKRTKLKFRKEYHMDKGTIKRLTDRGFGFIQTAEGTELFFHRSELEGVEFNSLSEGQEVEFEKGQGRDGRPQAVKVRLAEAEVKEEPSSVEETAEAPEVVEEGSTEAT